MDCEDDEPDAEDKRDRADPVDVSEAGDVADASRVAWVESDTTLLEILAHEHKDEDVGGDSDRDGQDETVPPASLGEVATNDWTHGITVLKSVTDHEGVQEIVSPDTVD